LDALGFTALQAERGEQEGPATPRLLQSGTDRTETAVCTSPTVLKEGTLFMRDRAGERLRRFFQLVKKPPSDKDSAQLMLVVFKADQNLQKLQPPPVGAAESASAT
jgi:hypothetical protein